MSNSATPSRIAPEKPEPISDRILAAARNLLWSKGLSAFTMDELAQDLGMSKKTLYVHFPSKDAIHELIIERMSSSLRTKIEAIIANPSLNCTEKLCILVDTVGDTLGRLTPAMFKELKRCAPSCYAKIEEVRSRNIPIYLGLIIRSGIEEGSIRSDLDPVFACEFWRQTIKGLLEPETLERTQLTIRQTLERAIHLFFHGLLTPAGRTQYQRHLKGCARQGEESTRVL